MTARLSGFVELEGTGSQIRSLRMATVSAAYGGHNFGVAVRSLEAK